MRQVFAVLLPILMGCSSAHSISAELCPPTNKNLEWSSKCFTGTTPTRKVKPQYIRQIVPTKAGFATIMIDSPRELLVVDASGAVRVPNIVHTGDFDFPHAENGLARFEIKMRNRRGRASTKCGYFNSTNYRVVIPALYDECLTFRDHVATVCKGCSKYCTESECQNSIFVGGHGLVIDRNNKVLQHFSPPDLGNACGENQLGKVTRLGKSTRYLNCSAAPDSAFRRLR